MVVGTMKVAICMFPLAKLGGIWTWVDSLAKGMKRLDGVQVDEYEISFDGKPFSSPMKTRNLQLLRMDTEAHAKHSIETLNKYDVVVYSYNCPRKTTKVSKYWKMLYNDTETFKVAVWHDFMKHPSAMFEIAERINLHAATCSKAYAGICKLESAMKKSFQKTVIGHPMDLVGLGLYENVKEPLVISTSQFRSWKRVHVFIKAIPMLKPYIKKEVYSGGIEQHYMAIGTHPEKLKAYVQKKLNEAKSKPDDKITKITTVYNVLPKLRFYGTRWHDALNAGMVYLGFQPSHVFEEAYKRAMCCVTISKAEYSREIASFVPNFKDLEYTVLETVKFGGIPVVTKNQVAPPKAMFVEEGNSEDEFAKNLADAINVTIDYWKDSREERIENARWLVQNFDAKKIASKLLEYVK
jgi:glycosyltransferase involved in cell wall biosynthesis